MSMAEEPAAGTGNVRLGDPGRIAALRRAGIDDDPSEVLDWLTTLTTRVLGAPVALVSLVDRDRQVFRSASGLDVPQTPLSHSFCKHVVARETVFLVRDANADPLVAGNLAIESLGVVAYAGVPLVDRDGYTLGSFCAIDHVPREWTQEEVDLLYGLATVATAELERRSLLADFQDREWRLRRERELMEVIVSDLGVAAVVAGPDIRILRTVGDTKGAWGIAPGDLAGRRAVDVLPGLPAGDSLLALDRGDRSGGIRGGGWAVLPLHDDEGTMTELVIVRAPGAPPLESPVTEPDAPDAPDAVLPWVGLPIEDPSGVPVGRVEGVLSSSGAGPPWFLVRLRGGHHAVVPTTGAVAAGGRLVASFAAEGITASPMVEPGRIEDDVAREIAAHYDQPGDPGPLDVVLYDVA